MKAFLERVKNNNNIKYIVGVGGSVVCVFGLWLGIRDNAYALSVNGQVVAVVKEKEAAQTTYEDVVNELKNSAGVDIAVNDTISIEPVHSSAKEIKTQEELKDVLMNTVSYNVAAYEILVDGVSYAVVESKEVAAEILAEIAKEYLPGSGELELEMQDISQVDEAEEIKTPAATEVPVVTEGQNVESELQHAEETTPEELNMNVEGASSKAEVLQVPAALPETEVQESIHVGSIEVDGEAVSAAAQDPEEGQKIERGIENLDFNEKVTIKNTYVAVEDILTAEEAKNVLLSNTEESIEYELKEGDNIWDIAQAHGTTMEHILEINPQITDETKMQIGEVIKLEVPEPILSISTTETATFKELIPAEIQYVWFSHLYEDQTVVYRDGTDGLKEITVAVNKVNGKEVSRTQLSEKIITEPVIKVMAYGTKKRPVEEETKPKKSSAGASVSSSGSGRFMHPLNGGGTISSGYGSRWSAFHSGIDFAAPAGTPIYAAAAGEVIYSGYNSGGYGKLVIIDHGNGYQTYYAHCSSLYVNVGQTVSKGQNIAGVGTTGNSTGNHLHFEIRKNGTPVNPYSYLY